eukprot:5783753-Prymnesium_polylepis.1
MVTLATIICYALVTVTTHTWLTERYRLPSVRCVRDTSGGRQSHCDGQGRGTHSVRTSSDLSSKEDSPGLHLGSVVIEAKHFSNARKMLSIALGRPEARRHAAARRRSRRTLRSAC